MSPHNYRSRSSLLDVSTRTIPWTAKTSFVSPRHQYKAHVLCCSRRQDSNSQPRLLILLLTLTCSLHMVRLLLAFPVMPCSRLFTQVGTHPVRSATTAKRSASTALAGTHNPVGSDPRTGTGPFPKLRALVLPMVKNLGNPNLMGLVTLTLPTAISCISGIQARRAEILPTLSPMPVESFMRLFFRKPVIMFRTSQISSWRTPATRTSLSCSTRTPLSLNL